MPNDPHTTQTVFNQPSPFEDVNLFTTDHALAEALRREGGEWAEERARAFGEVVGRRETIALGFQANEHPPVLRAFDRAGRRIDEVEYHPAWHSLLTLGVEHGLHAMPGRSRARALTSLAPPCSCSSPRWRPEWDARSP